MVVTLAFAGLLRAAPILAADTPADLVREVNACGDNGTCLAEHVSKRVYFPEARGLVEASPECAVAFNAAKERDGYGWYLTADEFVGCVLSTTEWFPGRKISPREAWDQCFSDPAIEHVESRDSARLSGSEFFCELERGDRGWVVKQLILKP